MTGLVFFIYQGFVQPAYSEDVADTFRVFTEYTFVIFNTIIIIVTGYWSIKNPFEVYNLSEQQIQEIQDKTETVPIENNFRNPEMENREAW